VAVEVLLVLVLRGLVALVVEAGEGFDFQPVRKVGLQTVAAVVVLVTVLVVLPVEAVPAWSFSRSQLEQQPRSLAVSHSVPQQLARTRFTPSQPLDLPTQ